MSLVSTDDQAFGLRRLAGARPARDPGAAPAARGPARVIAVTSGKGGVGKTSVSANLSVALARAGNRVLAIDGDLGLADLNLVLGIQPRFTLRDVVSGRKTVEEALCDGPGGIKVLPACPGDFELANLGEAERHAMFAAIDTLEDKFDTVVIDTGAGIGSNAVSFAAAATEVLLVCTPDATSVADAYAIVKVLATRYGVQNVWVLPNQVDGAREAAEVFQRLSRIVARFLPVRLAEAGYITRDPSVGASLAEGVPFVLARPDAPSSRCVTALAARLADARHPSASGGVQLFWRRLLGGAAS